MIKKVIIISGNNRVYPTAKSSLRLYGASPNALALNEVFSVTPVSNESREVSK